MFCDYLNGKTKITHLKVLLFLIFYKGFGILLQKKYIEVDSVQEVCLIQPVFENFIAKKL